MFLRSSQVRLALNDAVEQFNQEEWSEGAQMLFLSFPSRGVAMSLFLSLMCNGLFVARKKAWKLRDRNANAYYYRFLDPGQKQNSGEWTEVAPVVSFFKKDSYSGS